MMYPLKLVVRIIAFQEENDAKFESREMAGLSASSWALVLVVIGASTTCSSTPTATEASLGLGSPASAGLFNIRPLSIFTGHCNASIARGAAIWKPVPGFVDVFFPKVVSPDTFLSLILGRKLSLVSARLLTSDN